MVSSNFAAEDLSSITSSESATYVTPVAQDLFTTGTLASSFSTVFKNYGYCNIHNTNEFWITTGSPNSSPPPGHSITAGTNKYLQIK